MKFKYIILLILFFNQSAKGAENLFLYKGTFSRSITIEELSKFKLTKKPSNKLKNLIKITGQKEKNLHKILSTKIEFPIKTSRTLRGALAMREFKLELQFVEAIFHEYWENDNSDIQNYQGMAPIVKRLGVNQEEFEQLCESDEIRKSLIDSTNNGIKRGVFGVPSIFVGDAMFWGKDRMEFVEDELMKIK